MQRFTLIHDGSDQGWQAAYLAFHIAAMLGAPLVVLLVESTIDKKTLAQIAVQIEVGGRAAGVAIGTRLVADLSLEVVAGNAADSDGLFVPRSLIPDENIAMAFLEALSYPIWVVSHGTETNKVGVLVSDLAVDRKMISYTMTLSHRLQQSLIGLTQEEMFTSMSNSERGITWILLPDLSLSEVVSALDLHNIDILFIPSSNASLIKGLTSNYVLYPET